MLASATLTSIDSQGPRATQSAASLGRCAELCGVVTALRQEATGITEAGTLHSSFAHGSTLCPFVFRYSGQCLFEAYCLHKAYTCTTNHVRVRLAASQTALLGWFGNFPFGAPNRCSPSQERRWRTWVPSTPEAVFPKQQLVSKYTAYPTYRGFLRLDFRKLETSGIMGIMCQTY